MVRHTVLLRRLRNAAKAQEVSFELKRQGKEHEVWTFGNTSIAIPRHRDIDERLAQALLKRVGA